MSAERVRVDRWIFAVRAVKSRSLANELCSTGRVRVNDDVAKPATKVRIGDTVTVRSSGRMRVLEVRQLLEKRVGAAAAAEAFVDHSPPPERSEDPAATGHARRDRGSGRPTKRDRRQLDRFRRG